MQPTISKQEIINLYITQNRTAKDSAEILGISRKKFFELIKYFEIKKDNFLVQLNIETSNLQRYGTKRPLQNIDIQQKTKETNKEKYGCDNPMKSENIKKKVRTANLQKYGVECSLLNEDVKEKIKKTNIKRYGVENPLKNNDIKKKVAQTIRSKYDVSHVSQIYMSPKTINILNDKNLLVDFINKSDTKTIIFLSDLLGCSYTCLYTHCKKYDILNLIDKYTSKYELEIKDILSHYGLEFRKNNSVIAPYEIDLYNDKLKIGIEFNGDYWHNEKYKDKNYHVNKSITAEKNGIFIYFIYEHEWNNIDKRQKIINQLKNLCHINQHKIFARMCEIRYVDTKEKNLFLKLNHVQGKDLASVKLGLYYKDKLVSLMTFCKPRFNKNYDWELSRFCSLANTNVIGGASKLFKFFINNYSGSIISYSDVGKTKGNIYKLLGFEFVKFSPPNYVWWKNNKIKTRYQTQMKDEIYKMTQDGYLRIFDSGNKVWVYDYNKDNIK